MRKRTIIATLLFSAAFLLFPGCYTLDAKAVSKDYSVNMGNPEGKEAVGHFVEKAYVHHFVFGLITLSNDQVQKIVDNAVGRSPGAAGVANLTVKHRWTFLALLANGFTAALYAPTQVIVEGDLVK